MSQANIPAQQVSLETALVENLGGDISVLPPQAWEFGLTIGVEREKALDVFSKLKSLDAFKFNMLIDVTATDFMDIKEPRFEVNYQLLSIEHNHRLAIKISVDEDEPWVNSIRPLWSAANFLEREVFDMYGIRFEGHGDLRRILMYDEFVGHPLRKDYPVRGKQPRVELRIPELRNTAEDMVRDPLVSLPSSVKSSGGSE